MATEKGREMSKWKMFDRRYKKLTDHQDNSMMPSLSCNCRVNICAATSQRVKMMSDAVCLSKLVIR